MAWITPKTDWTPTGQPGVKDSDYNRIEGNTSHLRGLIHICGAPYGLTSISGFTPVQKTYINLPAGHKVVLTRENASLDATYGEGAEPLLEIRGQKEGQADTRISIVGILGNRYVDNFYPDGKTLGGNFTNSSESAVDLFTEVSMNPRVEGATFNINARKTSWQLVFDIVPV